MTAFEYVAGVARGLAMLVALATIVRVVRARLASSGSAAAPALLGGCVAALTVLFACAQLLGTVGLLSYWPLTTMLALVALRAVLLAPPPRSNSGSKVGPGPHHPPQVREEGAERTALCIIAIALVAGVWSIGLARAYDVGTHDHDSLRYHLPLAATFAQEHSITELHFLELDHLATVAPSNSELLNAVAISVTGNDVLTPLVGVSWVALALLAAWCLGRRWHAGAICAAAVAIVLMLPISGAGSAKNDVAVVALLLAGLALFAQRTTPGAAALAAAAAGLAVSTKLTAAAPAAVLLVCLLVAQRRGGRPIGTVVVAAVVTGSYWYGRNLARTGSLVPAADITVGPVSLSRAPDPVLERFGHTIADHATDGRFWRETVPDGLHLALGRGWLLALCVVAIGTVVAVVSRDRVAQVAAAVAMISGAVYLVTPYSAGGTFDDPWLFPADVRFALPAVTIGLLLFAGVRSRVPGTIVTIAIGVLLVATLLSRAGPYTTVPDHFRSVGALAFAATVAVGFGRSRVSRGVARGAVLLVVIVALIGGHFVQRQYLRERFVESNLTTHLQVDRWASTVDGARIATSGITLTYPLYGRELTNRVEYLGRDGGDGSFTSYPSCTAFLDAVAAGDFDYVVVGTFKSGLETAPEREWAAADTNLQPIVQDGDVVVFEVRGEVDGASCSSASPALEPIPA